ncbi:HEAT repeat domain-containing protein [Leptolyngbya sp. PCC 6406]|uniref:HEAT repeat domain-containing protein n=1 Tax=Leptolyngbya sp. PCC 6406 TaxID=1173264 RepID=UPI0002AC31BC|nr:HEAT repeat domain-containing protein [Leptolyngbya sp. PCC 6406]
MSSPNSKQIIYQIRNTTTPTEAALWLRILVENRTQSTILALIQLLDHHYTEIASMSAQALEQFAPDSVEPLIAAFDDSIDHGMQARIVQILANVGDDRALLLLINMVGVEIANHCQGNVRRIAARGLGKMLRSHPSRCNHHSQAIDKLIWALLHTEDWALRYAAAVSLGEIATDEAINALQQALVQENDRVVQQRIHLLFST